jgi:hypothetical protein
MKRNSILLLALTMVIASSALFTTNSALTHAKTTAMQQSTAEQVMSLGNAINSQLEANGANYRVGIAEYLTKDDSGEVGQTLFFANVGNKQLGHHFVPGDPRRGGRTDITYIVDQAEGAIDGLTVVQTTTAIDRAMATWENVNCSTIPITKLPDIPANDLGAVEFLNGLGGSPFFLADITHAGWLPGGILPNNVIAVTFTFIFVTFPGPVPTDIDNNGKLDVAFREILYNDVFLWQNNGNIDVETVALHEAGHGLSQAHFGALFGTDANGKFHFAPRAVMNAGYTGVQQSLKGTDNGGHCSIWAQWPNN